MVDSVLTGSFKISGQDDPKTHAFIIVAGKCLIPVDDTLVQKLGIKDGDAVYQEVDDKGSIRLVFKKSEKETI
ncbi:MAG: hypothetical protein ACRD8W_07660 [Nitrososphaeraceae archaeon]